MTYYPVFFDLRGRPVLVIGAGKVALRKTLALVEAGARVTVVAPHWEPAFEGLPVTLVRRPFEPPDTMLDPVPPGNRITVHGARNTAQPEEHRRRDPSSAQHLC
jgi:hypothetical protein